MGSAWCVVHACMLSCGPFQFMAGRYVKIIGVSVNEPHTSELNCGISYCHFVYSRCSNSTLCMWKRIVHYHLLMRKIMLSK